MKRHLQTKRLMLFQERCLYAVMKIEHTYEVLKGTNRKTNYPVINGAV